MAGDPRNWMWAEACALIEQAERLQRHAFQPGMADARQPSWEPPVDVFESGREILIVAALPGVEAEDLEVSIGQNLIVVAGERRLPRAARGAIVHRLEIPHGRFERQIHLPTAGLQLAGSELTAGCLFLSLIKRN